MLSETKRELIRRFTAAIDAVDDTDNDWELSSTLISMTYRLLDVEPLRSKSNMAPFGYGRVPGIRQTSHAEYAQTDPAKPWLYEKTGKRIKNDPGPSLTGHIRDASGAGLCGVKSELEDFPEPERFHYVCGPCQKARELIKEWPRDIRDPGARLFGPRPKWTEGLGHVDAEFCGECGAYFNCEHKLEAAGMVGYEHNIESQREAVAERQRMRQERRA